MHTYIHKSTAAPTHADVIRMFALGYAHHPQKLVDAVARISDDATEYQKHVG